MKISAIEWLKKHLPLQNGEPILVLEEINDYDDGYDDALKITKGEHYDKDKIDGDFNIDSDEVEEIEVEVAKTLFVVRKNVVASHHLNSIFLFSSTNEDETEEEFYILAKKELKPEALVEFSNLYPNY